MEAYKPEISNDDLLKLIGQKEIELFTLRKYVVELQKQLKSTPKEQKTGE